MPDRSFRKHERLLHRPQFKKIMAEGRKQRVEDLCTLFYLPNGLGHNRLGIIASRKIGNAVARNRAKRKIREVFRHHKQAGPAGMDIVVVSGRNLVPLPCTKLETKLANTLRRMK
ncbi:ribonuclease P protein component [Nitrospina gracilis]|uniref:ribonuclease P protein component n=1 Tax=Nitrospina gracilis TaxID=35801 RepID=UPI001EFFF0AA|nr:ribonuclease P protein component [Nitrospina gracilis]MCF8719778.1 ribonuclease P protein component [Nitrospina gracilis Nb-211]